MSETHTTTQRPDAKSSLFHEDLSILKVFKHLNGWRILILVIILFLAFVFTLFQPDSWLNHFSKSFSQVLTRVWILASLLITLTVSIWIYLKTIRVLDKDISQINQEKLLNYVQSRRDRCYFLNLLMVVLVVLLGVATARADFPLKIINLGSGILLVTLITIFDIIIAMISYNLMWESIKSSSNDGGEGKCDDLKLLCTRHRNDRNVILQLDVPILIGVTITWFLGYVILPSVLNGVEESYASGFATGAIALQLLVGNIAFEIINACSST